MNLSPDDLLAHLEGAHPDALAWIDARLRLLFASPEQAREALTSLLEAPLLDALLEARSPWQAKARAPSPAASSLDRHFADHHRKKHGIYYTPHPWDEVLASGLLLHRHPERIERVIDLSAGQGALLCATLRLAPHLHAVAVEREPAAAIATALSLHALRRDQQMPPSCRLDRVILSDGLSGDLFAPGSQQLVIGNPPYLGEKGRGELFRELQQQHTHLAPHFCARMDLLYLFLHQALALLAPGGLMIHLTSAYWLQATGARHLRQELLSLSEPRLFWQLTGAPLFPDAPGHHSLISLFERRETPRASPAPITLRAVSRTSAPTEPARELLSAYEEAEPTTLALDEARALRPFAPAARQEASASWRQRCAPLREFLKDSQGFVSGADRLSRAHLERLDAASRETLQVGRPIFLFESREQVPEALWALEGEVLLPVLRGADVRQEQVWREHEATCWALYVDGELEGEALERVTAHLEPVRAVLERRREVESGKIPWYRMHWPRRRAEQLGPKLVMARRGPRFCVGLDLAGHLVSSDCTYLTLHQASQLSPRQLHESLMRVAICLHGAALARDLEVYGKQKGRLYEFYSEPLKGVPLPLRRGSQGVLWWDEEVLDEAQVAAFEEAMRCALEGEEQGECEACGGSGARTT